MWLDSAVASQQCENVRCPSSDVLPNMAAEPWRMVAVVTAVAVAAALQPGLPHRPEDRREFETRTYEPKTGGSSWMSKHYDVNLKQYQEGMEKIYNLDLEHQVTNDSKQRSGGTSNGRCVFWMSCGGNSTELAGNKDWTCFVLCRRVDWNHQQGRMDWNHQRNGRDVGPQWFQQEDGTLSNHVLVCSA